MRRSHLKNLTLVFLVSLLVSCGQSESSKNNDAIREPLDVNKIYGTWETDCTAEDDGNYYVIDFARTEK